MKIVAAIPARGGSVGLPGKNIRPLNGVPLVGRTIRAAKGSRFMPEVFVSSDSDEILSVARRFGAIGVERPIELSGPTASSESALIHLLQNEPSLVADPPDILVFLQCTAPFTLAHHVDMVVEALLEQKATSALSVVDDHGFYWKVGEDGSALGINHDPSKPRERRQDLPPRYRENGAVYAMRVPEFLESGNRYCGKTILVPLDSTWIEIDTSQDWDMAEAFIRTEAYAGTPEQEKFSSIRALITSFEGVHTDNTISMDANGNESLRCNRGDEIGLERLVGRDIRLLMLGREDNPIARARAQRLAMAYRVHPFDKRGVLDEWRQTAGFEWHEIAYVGEDVSDLDAMRSCGLSFAPRSAQADIKAVANVILDTAGGQGVLREVSDILISRRNVLLA